MMFMNAIVAAALLASSTVVAAPPALVAARQKKQEIRICRDVNYVLCADIPFENDVCLSFGVNQAANDAISSLDTYGFDCNFYIDVGCPSSGFFQFKGQQKDVSVFGKNSAFQDKISSLKCKID
ncbi:hypothetical protein LZ554_000015 [Drepanopeziza brunnea f. sp. 'monogermtubi']|nr:hypothetical protein LZ554_000015 [Drepanopeziza brunnea f. sp. 'monogermtubi']